MSHARLLLASCLLLTTYLPAQMNMACHDTSAKKELAPPDQLPAPLHLTGIGNSQMKITASPEAQLWFNQGLTLLHDFWDYESARAFQQAIRVDPKCAMCYWGLSKALGNSHGEGASYGARALDQAVALKSRASKKEQFIIEATVAESTEDRDLMTLGRDKTSESAATTLWRKALAKDPKDPQLKIFLAESMIDGYDDAGEPKPGTQKAIALLEEVLKDHPDDSAANHYWIHAMEPSSHPERAIDSAKKLASLAPASGHMVHMPGHIFYRGGDYAQAELWFTASTAVDEQYMHDQHINIDDDWNYVHNLMYGIANLMEEGKLQQATALSSKLAAARGQFAGTLYTHSPRDGVTRINTLLPIALRTGNWSDVQSLLAASKPDAKLENLLFLAGELKDFAHGMQAVQEGDLATADSMSTHLDAALWRKSQAVNEAKSDDKPKSHDRPSSTATPTADIMPDAMAQPLLASLSIMSLELRASILAAQNNLAESKKLFAQAAKEEKNLGYHEPPTYIRPVGETEGLALLRAGDHEGAHKAFAAALLERPNSGFCLYGMARSSEAAHHADTARAEYSRFLEAWRSSDPNSAELDHARAYLAAEPVVAALNQ